MAVVEVGTFHVRVGYVGDITCTSSLPALQCPGAVDELDLMSILRSTSSSSSATTSRSGAHAANEEASEDALLPLWTLRSLHDHPEAHVAHLRAIKHAYLGCAEETPLMLVLPESWFAEPGLVEGVVSLLLEEPDLTSALYLCRPSVAWTLSCGRTSAVVLDVGHSHTTVAAVMDGYALRQTVASSSIGGAVVTAQYEAMLCANQFLPATIDRCYTAADGFGGAATRAVLARSMASKVKHAFGYVYANADTPAPAPSVPFKAPDGTTLSLSDEQRAAPFNVFFHCPENTTFRHAKLGDVPPLSVAEMVSSCKGSVDPEWQLQSVHHILAGAGSLVPGFKERAVAELKEKDSSYFRYERDNAIAMAKHTDGAWSGASLAASSSAFESLWLTRSEWNEHGVSCLRKLFY